MTDKQYNILLNILFVLSICVLLWLMANGYLPVESAIERPGYFDNDMRGFE